MKLAAITIICATLALANPAPAPIAEPEAIAVAHPESPLEALAAAIAARKVSSGGKGGKGGKGGSGGNDTEGAAITFTPSRALEIGALSLGVLEIVRLWG